MEKPVKRLWLSSMTRGAIEDAFARLRPGEEMAPRGRGALALGGRLGRGDERDARGLDPAARGVRRRRLAGPRSDSDARARSPAGRRRSAPTSRSPTGSSRPPSRRRASAPTAAATWAEAHRRGRGRDDRRGLPRPARRDHEARQEGGARATAAPLRPDLAPAPRQLALRLLGPADARRGAEALRGPQGDHLPAHELAIPDERHDRRDPADRRARGP